MERDHYPTASAARASYEKQNATVTAPSPVVYPREIRLSNPQKHAVASKLKYLGLNASFILDKEDHDEHLFISFYTTFGGEAEISWRRHS
jgi:hypothetical protein